MSVSFGRSSLLSGICFSSNVDSKNFCFGPMSHFNECKNVIELRVDFDRMASGRKAQRRIDNQEPRVAWRVTFVNP